MRTECRVMGCRRKAIRDALFCAPHLTMYWFGRLVRRDGFFYVR